MNYDLPTKMDPISYEILTNSNFDYSKLTLDDMVTMVTFWAFRFGQPIISLKAWIMLLRINAPTLMTQLEKMILEKDAEHRLDEVFKARRGNFYKVAPIEEFDEAAAAIKHGNWPPFIPRSNQYYQLA